MNARVATVRNYTNMELHGALNFAKEYSDFPSDAQRNDMALINGVLWVYSMIGGLLTWFPLNNQKNTYVHTQGAASTLWTINHGMNSQDLVFNVYDTNNKLTFPGELTFVDTNSFTLAFSEAVLGRVVCIFSTELFAPTVTAQSLVANSAIFGGVVTADATGLKVNGQQVVVLDGQGQASFGTL